MAGDYLAIGAPLTNGDSGDDTGAVYVFKRSGTAWLLEQAITDEASGFTALEAGDWFGAVVALDGNRLAVSALYDDGAGQAADTGAVYVFKRSGETWTLEHEIADQATGFTALQTDDFFGYSLDIAGDRLAVGAYLDHGASGYNTGAVYIFQAQ